MLWCWRFWRALTPKRDARDAETCGAWMIRLSDSLVCEVD